MAQTIPLRSRLLLALLALATMLSLVLPPPVAVAAEDYRPNAEAAADWIARELASGAPDFDIFGKAPARADVIFALASVGTNQGAARRALLELRPIAGDYASTGSGQLAKVLLAVLVSGQDPRSFVAGRDLEADLRAAMEVDGRFSDDVFSHSLAMLALAATSGGIPPQATAWLLARQDADGWWANPWVPDEADFDYTALAVQALVAAGSKAGADRGAAFLAASQNDDGSWPSPFGDPNANTAGLAGQALRAAGLGEAADAAADFVTTLQGEDGGIKFVLTDDEPNGFATLQGVLALGGPAYHLLRVDPFADVDWEHLFATEISWLAFSGITRGCDPPRNDRFCPEQVVTRGQMAAFLHRALRHELPAGEPTAFTDVAGSIFAQDIAWLSATGITRGCNPPTNDRFCPNDPVTRGQMAAFLHRALRHKIPAGEPTAFTDVAGSIFAQDIAWLSATGITRGCNPPTNDRFCPHDPVTRGQMAAFLYRALRG